MALPNETLTTVFENLQPCDLAPVLRTSARFRLVAERVLYTHISITEAISRLSPTPQKTICFCDTLGRRSHLADHPRRLTVRWSPDGGASDDYVQFVQPALLALNRALYVLPQLETLELALGLSGAGITFPAVLEGCTFPSLRLFALSGIGHGIPPLKGPFDTPMSAAATPAAPAPTSTEGGLTIERFLAATPSIQHLRLADHYAPLRLPPAALPQLASFRGPPMAAASVCPGRAIQRLALVGGDYIAPADISAIAQTRTHIVLLDLSSMSVTPSLLQALSRQLDRVNTLRVRLALRHTLHFALSGISILAGLTPVLGAFRELRQLDLSPTTVVGIGPGNPLEEAALCTTWARGCPSLRQITFPSHTEWSLSPELVWVPHPSPMYSRS